MGEAGKHVVVKKGVKDGEVRMGMVGLGGEDISLGFTYLMHFGGMGK